MRPPASSSHFHRPCAPPTRSTHPKPAPDIYLAACAALGTEPARTLVLEDSPTGVAAARAAGCYTIGVPSLEGVELAGADLVVASLAAPAITRALGL